MVAAQAPADDLPAFEIHDDRQVTETAAQSQISEVLAPGVGFGHQAVILAGPRPPGIFEDGIFAQNIGRRLRLGLAPTITPPFGSDRDNNAGQIADPAGLVGAPAKVQSQPADAVEKMLRMGGLQIRNSGGIFGVRRRPPVKTAPGNA